MATVELARFNPQSFEQLIQALSFAELGPGGVVYSPGPDGGRDFVFNGKIRGYERWNGKLVIQAKFRERLEGGEKDIAWLRKQIAGERTKIKSLGDVNFYIVATNVALSGSDGKGASGRKRQGGLSKIDAELSLLKKFANIKDTDVWSAHKICRLIDNHDGIRRKYACWLSPGDVLAQLMDALNGVFPDFEKIIRRALLAGLERDRLSRLEDAGEELGRKLPLDATFIDLPLVANDADPADERFHPNAHLLLENDDIPPPQNKCALARLLERSKYFFGADEQLPSSAEDDARTSNRIILLGGPGQGKSTVTTYLLQILRAHLLRGDTTLRKRDGKPAELLKKIIERAAIEGVGDNIPRRYPVHVDLSRYADFCATQPLNDRERVSILNYLALELGRASNQLVSAGAIRRWLETFPWLVVLDGLDEVSASASRATVIRAIREFSDDVIDCRGDVMIVVTTRPQGYNDDLDPSRWDRWTLADLEPKRALRYAALLTEARHPGDVSKHNESKQIFETALQSDAIGALMKSPLQVTILNVLAATGDALPTVRWSLFNDYYLTLKRRETRKHGVGSIIGDNSRHIDAIHCIAGRRLHEGAEADGKSSSFFTKEAFSELVENYLSSKGFSNDELKAKTKEISDAALDRLVLLSARESDRIRFDVRSLQEFMAAASISNDIDHLRENINELCKSAHWRHVLLIIASRCFADQVFERFQDTILGLADHLQAMGKADFLAMTGPRLALDLFCDGVAAEFPDARKRLAHSAIALLDLGRDSADNRIVRLFAGYSRQLAFERFEACLAEAGTPRYFAAWKIVMQQAASGDSEATEVATAKWPTEGEYAAEILAEVKAWTFSPEFAERIASSIRNLGTVSLRTMSKRSNFSAPASVPPHLRSALNCLNFEAIRREKVIGIYGPGNDRVLQITVSSVDLNTDQKAVLATLCENGWVVLSHMRAFLEAPSATELAALLNRLTDSKALQEAKLVRWVLPWVLSSILDACENDDSLKIFASAASKGEFGDIADWRAAENRWEARGILRDDLLACAREFIPVRGFAKAGWPLHHSTRLRVGRIADVANDLFAIGLQLPNGVPRLRLLDMAAFVFGSSELADAQTWNPKTIRTLLECTSAADSWATADCARRASEVAWESADVRACIAAISSLGSVVWSLDRRVLREAYECILRDDHLRGLAVPLVISVADDKEALDSLPSPPVHLLSSDTPAIAGALKLLNSMKGDHNPTALHYFTQDPMPRTLIESMVKAIGASLLPVDLATDILIHVIERARVTNEKNSSRFTILLRSTLDRRPITLH